MLQRTDRTHFEREVIGSQDWGIKDYLNRHIGVLLIRERYEHTAAPAGAYRSFKPGSYVTFLAYTTRNGTIAEGVNARVLVEGPLSREVRLEYDFNRKVEASKHRATVKAELKKFL